MEFLLALGGFAAGFIDAIAGGGGLITLPIYYLIFGVGPEAIGTNKINGFTAAFVAWVIYASKKHFDFRSCALFAFPVFFGAFAGGMLSPLLPPHFFFWLLLAVCPAILYFVFRKEIWLHAESEIPHHRNKTLIILTGFVCGIYDGAFGPGGGTFYLLGLFFVAKLNLFAALACSKFVNAISAGSGLIAFQSQGMVRWQEGLWVGAGMGVGAFFGAHLASKKAARIVKPMLVLVVSLLMVRLTISFFFEK